MTAALPELRGYRRDSCSTGNFVDFNHNCEPHFPLVAQRVLFHDRTVGLTYIFFVFDVLRIDGADVMAQSFPSVARDWSGCGSAAQPG